MRNDQRQFFVYDLEIGARKVGAAIPSMATVLNIWLQRQAVGETLAIRGNTGTLLVGAVAVDPQQQTATLLIRFSDQMAPNSVYSNPLAGTFNEHLKQALEGADFGCHVLLSTAPEAASPNVYTCAIERVVGLPASLVQRLLSKLLTLEFQQNPVSFQYPHPGGGLDRAGNPRLERCCPHIELRGRPSDTLIDDINRGRLTGVSLVRTEAVTPIAGAAFLTKKRSELELGIDHQNLPANLWANIRAALQRNAPNFPNAKISYRLPGVTRTVTVEIDAATGNPLSDLYVETFELSNLRPPLAQSSPNIVPHLVQAAMPLMIAKRAI